MKILLLALLINHTTAAATPDSAWTLEKCISYALNNNIQVRKAGVTIHISEANAVQARSSRYPSVNAGVNQNYSWNNQQVTITSGNLVGYAGTNISVNSNFVVFNGFKINGQVKQSKVNLEAVKYDAETTKESITLNILNAYLQVLYAEEQVKNSRKQVELTEQQLELSSERLNLGASSRSDYLQVKSQLASEKQTLATAESTLAMDRITLIQLMELPADTALIVYHPSLEPLSLLSYHPRADSVYQLALAIKPQVKSAAFNKESARLNVKIVKADYYPSLSLSAGLGMNFAASGQTQASFDDQINPTVGVSLNIPIYQNYKVKSNVNIAKLNTSNAELDEANIRNQLRKSIEQGAQDVVSSCREYESGLEQYNAAYESYLVADEKFRQGLISSVDFLVQKTNLIVAEGTLLQSKYKLIFSRKILDFYSGIPITI
ncbi:MAG: TolC family protein [Bacteroidetes bacterium]|nr:TolC family protein [Bacteroidota bacterium]